MAVSDAEYIGDGRPDGTIVGRTSTELVGFHGVTPVAQASFVSAVATTAAALTVYGYTTTAQANAIPTAINSILTVLINKGLMASS